MCYTSFFLSCSNRNYRLDSLFLFSHFELYCLYNCITRAMFDICLCTLLCLQPNIELFSQFMQLLSLFSIWQEHFTFFVLATQDFKYKKFLLTLQTVMQFSKFIHYCLLQSNCNLCLLQNIVVVAKCVLKSFNYLKCFNQCLTSSTPSINNVLRIQNLFFSIQKPSKMKSHIHVIEFWTLSSGKTQRGRQNSHRQNLIFCPLHIRNGRLHKHLQTLL